MFSHTRRHALALIGLGGFATLAQAKSAALTTLQLTTADGRICSVSRWRPRHVRGTILFSHGALSAPWKYEALILPWVTAGFEVWAPLHVDSTDHPATKDYPGLSSWPARLLDMRVLAAHVPARTWVAAGHSYGGLVALTLGGALPQRPPGVAGTLADPHVSCVMAFSPPGPNMGLIDRTGYAALAVPALIQTGTRDVFPGAPPEAWRDHLAAYEAPSAGGNRFALVLEDADHYFGGLICRPDLPGPRQADQLAAAIAVSTLFGEAYGLSAGRARARLLRRIADTGPVRLSRR